MLANSKFMITLIGVFLSLAGARFCFQIANLQNLHIALKQFLLILLLTNTGFFIKTSILIKDNVTKEQDKVDNLPIAFALPVGLLENFGYILTNAFEQVFTPVSKSSYSDYGMVFGARLLQDSKNWRIKSPELIENMQNYISRCIQTDALIGEKYTVQDLANSDDIWKLTKDNAGNFRKVYIRVNGSLQSVGCFDAAENYIELPLLQEFNNFLDKYKNTIFAKAGPYFGIVPRGSDINNNLHNNIQAVYGSFLNTVEPAYKIFNQYLLLNALDDNISDYSVSRASQSQKTSWLISGELASIYLPILLTLLKCLIYASFIFMIPLMIISGSAYKSYLTVILSLQLWGPLNAILNLFIQSTANSYLHFKSQGTLNATNFYTLSSIAEDITSLASGLQIFIPVLSWALVQGGLSGFIHLANQFISSAQGTASMVASEVTTGNKSFDNTSIGNTQLANKSGFKTDYNESYVSGAAMTQMLDGTIEKILPSGESFYQSGSGITTSTGNTKLNARESVASTLQKEMSHLNSLVESESRSFNDTKRATQDKAISFMEQLAIRESSGTSFDYNIASEDGQSLHESIKNAIQLHDEHGYSWNQAVQTSIKAGVGFDNKNRNTKPGLVGSLIEKATGGGQLHYDLSADGSMTLSNSSDQKISHSAQSSEDKSVDTNYSKIIRAMTNEQFVSTNNLDKTLSQDLKHSYENQQSLEKSLNIHKEQQSQYRDALSRTESKDANFEKEIYHTLQERVANAYNISTYDAHTLIEQGDAKIIPIKDNLIQEIAHGELVGEAIDTPEKHTIGIKADEYLDNFTNTHQIQLDREESSMGKDIKHHAKSEGLEKDFVVDDVKEKVETRINEENRIDLQKADNTAVMDDMQRQVEKFEENRIGMGKVGKWVGERFDKASRYTAGPNIGNPMKDYSKSNKSEPENTSQNVDHLQTAQQVKNDK